MGSRIGEVVGFTREAATTGFTWLAGRWRIKPLKRSLGIDKFQDNSGTFDKLIPYLLPAVGMLAIDLPGHGLSSQLPPGMHYHGVDTVTLVRRIKQYFGWPTVSLMGHSMGAISSYMYTVCFPDQVDLLICLDALIPVGRGVLDIESLVGTLNNFLKYDELNSQAEEPPAYTTDELAQKLYGGTNKSISLNSCKYILERNIRAARNDTGKFYFSRDSRLKAGEVMVWPPEFTLRNSHRVKCPLILIKARQSPLLTKTEHFDRVLTEIRKNNGHVHFHTVEGSHHVHLNNPEKIQHLINEFLKKYVSMKGACASL